MRAAESILALCAHHGLLMHVRRALGGAIATGRFSSKQGEEGESGGDEALLHGTSPRAVAAALRSLAFLVRAGGPCRTQACTLPLLARPSALAELMLRPGSVRRSASVQSAACDLIRATRFADHSTDSTSHAVLIEALTAALSDHGTTSARVAFEVCETIGTLSSDALLGREAYEPSLVTLVAQTLAAHGRHHRELARAACGNLRLLCLQNTAAQGAAARGRDDALAELRRAGGEEALVAAIDAHKLPLLRGVGADKLLGALRGAGRRRDGGS
jgi:hypothetical protein